MSKRIVLLAAAAVVAVGLAVQAATASPTKHAAARSTHLLVGMNDEPDTLYGNPATAFATLKLAEGAGAARQHVLGRQQVGRRQHEAGRRDRPGRSRVQLGALRPAGRVRAHVQHPRHVLDPVHAVVGKRRPGAHGRADEHAGPAGLRLRGRRAVQRPLDAAQLAAEPRARHRRDAAPEGEHVDGVERAEQPDLAHAAVQEGRQDVGDPEREVVRADLQRDLQRRALAVPRAAARASRSPAASPARRETTRRRPPAPPSIRSRS